MPRANLAQTLFDGQPDWLGLTLAQAFSDTTTAASRTTKPRAVDLADGSSLDLLATGVLRLTARHRTPNAAPLILSAGIHGNETAPIELLNNLVSELLDGQLVAGTDALFILGNPPAMLTGTRFIEFNLNRLFNGAHDKPELSDYYEALRARLLEHLTENFHNSLQREDRQRLTHYDLHTAIRASQREYFALAPFVPDHRIPDGQLRFLEESSVQTLVLQNAPATTFAAFTAEAFGAESLTLELGRAHPFGQNNLEDLAPLYTTLRRRLQGDPAPETAPAARAVTIYEVVHEIINTGANFRFHVPDDVANFTEFAHGNLIWDDGSESYRVKGQAEAVVFPNRNVPPGHRAGLMIRPLAESHTPPRAPESR